jgi:chromate transporter
MKELFWVFMRIGWLGFGGPIATIAMMEEETVRKRRWLDEREFSEIYTICKMLPGPVATQVAIYLGMLRKGRWGGALAGLTYIFPAFLIILCFSIVYVRHRIGTEYEGIFAALQTGALVVILTSTLALARPIWKSRNMIALMVVSAGLIAWFPLWEPVVILAGGLGAAWLTTRTAGSQPAPGSRMLAVGAAAGALPAFKWPVAAKLFWVCFKAGAFVFGTGLAIIPLLEADVVRHRHWLTHSEFMDGLMIGQTTPGPVATSVTFIGYKTAGLPGALVATAGVFLPNFINVLFIVPSLWKRVSGTPMARAFTVWAIPAVVGGIFATGLRLGIATVHTWPLVALFVVANGVAFRLKPPAWLLILGCGAVGVVAEFL